VPAAPGGQLVPPGLVRVPAGTRPVLAPEGGLASEFRRVDAWTKPVPEPVLGLALLALAAVFIVATLRDRGRSELPSSRSMDSTQRRSIATWSSRARRPSGRSTRCIG
jgi:hypothetical protein